MTDSQPMVTRGQSDWRRTCRICHMRTNSEAHVAQFGEEGCGYEVLDSNRDDPDPVCGWPDL